MSDLTSMPLEEKADTIEEIINRCIAGNGELHLVYIKKGEGYEDVLDTTVTPTALKWKKDGSDQYAVVLNSEGEWRSYLLSGIKMCIDV